MAPCIRMGATLHSVQDGDKIMGKGGGGGQSNQPQQVTTTSTNTTSNLPKYVQPQFERLLARAEAQSLEPYTPYEGQRLAETDSDVFKAYDMIGQVAADGTPVTDAAVTSAQGLANPYEGYNAYTADQFDYDPMTQFTGDNVSQYMSPYMDNVVQRQKAEALKDFQQMQAGRNSSAINAGAFGGSRQGVVEGMAQDDVLDRMSGIQTEGQQRAYQDAQSMFLQDRGAQMDLQRQRAAELARTQGISASEAARIQSGEVADLTRQQGALDFASGLEDRSRAASIQDAQYLETVGKSRQAADQAGLDLAYDDFLKQKAFPEQQLGLYSSVLRGIPVTPSTTATSMTPYNPVQQALGLGISGLGLYKGLMG